MVERKKVEKEKGERKLPKTLFDLNRENWISFAANSHKQTFRYETLDPLAPAFRPVADEGKRLLILFFSP